MGGEQVEKVTLGVSLNLEFLEEAIKRGSNFCIFHHGFDPRTYNSLYSLSSQKRLKAIIDHKMTVCGYHYALDAHPKIGNNALIIEKLEAELGESLFDEWGYVGTFPKPENIENLEQRCAQIFNHEIFSVYSGPKEISRIGVVSGAGIPSQEHLTEMSNKGIQLFISGETSESTPHKMRENGINYFVCGHYATEVFGVGQLGKNLRNHFGDDLEIEFIDIYNAV